MWSNAPGRSEHFHFTVFGILLSWRMYRMSFRSAPDAGTPRAITSRSILRSRAEEFAHLWKYETCPVSLERTELHDLGYLVGIDPTALGITIRSNFD
jgi:hypothetical protein